MAKGAPLAKFSRGGVPRGGGCADSRRRARTPAGVMTPSTRAYPRRSVPRRNVSPVAEFPAAEFPVAEFPAAVFTVAGVVPARGGVGAPRRGL